MRHTYIYEVEYTKALAQGSLKLLIEPEETLLNLENPYDETARIAAGFDQIYDHVYYQGNYYVYFSILPQLILVPFHLLTGQYLNSLWLIIVFAVLGIISTVQLTKKIFAYWFPETKFGHFLLATLLMLFLEICGVLRRGRRALCPGGAGVRCANGGVVQRAL